MEKTQMDLVHGENIVRTLRDFHLRFDDFTYGSLNERVKQVVEAFKIENSVPLVIPKPKQVRKLSQQAEGSKHEQFTASSAIKILPVKNK